jgi:hypothetical protein
MPESLASLLLVALLLSGCASSPQLPVDSGLLPPNPPASLARDGDTESGSGPVSQQKTVEQQLAELEQFLASNEASFSGWHDCLSADR